MKIELDNGKYTYVFDGGKQYALRHGEPWRDLTGDNLTYWMGCRIEELEQKLAALPPQAAPALGVERTITEDEGHMIDAALMAGFTIIPADEGTAFTCTKEDIIALMTPWHEQNKALKDGTSEFDKGFLAGLAAATGPESAQPSFKTAEDLIKWLDTLYETEGDAITNRKWSVAQAAIAALSTPAVPPEWRKFVEDCAKTAGGMVNGNNLAQLAGKLLAAVPAPAAPAPAAPELDSIEWDVDGDLASADVIVKGERLTLVRQAAGLSAAKAIHYPQCWDTAAYPTLKSALHEVYAAFQCQQCSPQQVGAAELYAALRGMHWNDGKLAVVQAKDLKLGVQTYSGALLDEAIRATLPPQEDTRSLAIHDWFGLTYAQFLTLPRVIMDAMPAHWQEQMVVLLDELGETYDYLPANGNIYYVRVGRPAEWPYDKVPALKSPDRDLCNYRHPNIWHRKKNRKPYIADTKLGTPDHEVPKPESPDRG